MKKKTRPKTHVAIVLDRSGSMWDIREDTVKACNSIFDDIKKSAKDQDVTVSLFTFANAVTKVFVNEDVKDLTYLELNDFVPNGGTAMFDGVGEAIERFDRLKDVNDKNTSLLVLVITDGDENSSRRYNANSISNLFKLRQATDRWTFAFNVPEGRYKDNLINRFHISSDNVREWPTTKKGIEQTSAITGASMGNYFSARTRGVTSVKNFYTTNLANLTPQKVKKNLDNLKSKFKVVSVDKECPIKSLVESKVGNYTLGDAFYQLTKKEKIQPNKELLVMEKGKNDIWGGDEAKDLLGLDFNVEVKVEPGNHANWDIFVQSQSVNRKLVRGTKLLVRV